MLDDYEAEARTRSNGLEALGKLPAGFTEQNYPLMGGEQSELRRLKAALELADDADTFVALAKGRPVSARWYKHRLRHLLRR